MRAISLLAAAILVADQITKWWALHGLRFGEAVPVIPGLFSLTLVMNPGLAFGMPTTLILDKQGCVLASLAGPAEWSGEDAKALVMAAMGR